ncbi:hypothetical protein ACSQ67_024460 [Phaseolus vulgaris]
MLACPSSSLHGLATLQRHSQSPHFLLSNSLLFPPSPRLATSRKCNFRSLLSGRISRRSAVRASANSPEVSESVVGDGGALQPYSVKIPVGDRHKCLACFGWDWVVDLELNTKSFPWNLAAYATLKSKDWQESSFDHDLCSNVLFLFCGILRILVETGHIGRQASGSVTVTDGETIVYTTVCLDDVPSEPSDFFPFLFIIKSDFQQLVVLVEGFLSEKERQETMRLIDRPLRPTMPKGFYHDTQILSWVLSYDGLHSPDSLAVTAAGIAVALSEVPMSKAVAGVRVGLVGDKYIVNPTTKEMEHSELDLLLAGTDGSILMIEGYSNFIPEEKLLRAVEVGQDAVRAICNEVDALVKKCGKPKMLDAIKLPPPELYEHVECQYALGSGPKEDFLESGLSIGGSRGTIVLSSSGRWLQQEIAGDEIVKVLQIRNKIPRRKALSSLEEKVLNILTEKGFVSNDSKLRSNSETIAEILEDEDEDEEIIVDGEVDEGDVHIKLTSHKPALKVLMLSVD